MELIEIIVTTLKIFSLVSIIVVFLSYFFFKLKKQSRTTRAVVNERVSAPEEISEPEPVYQSVPVIDEQPVFQYQRPVQSERFKIVNNVVNRAEVYNNPQPVRPAYRASQRAAENGGINPYSYYAEADAGSTMHKIKFSGMRSFR